MPNTPDGAMAGNCKHCGKDVFKHELEYYGLEICANCADNIPSGNANIIAEAVAKIVREKFKKEINGAVQKETEELQDEHLMLVGCIISCAHIMAEGNLIIKDEATGRDYIKYRLRGWGNRHHGEDEPARTRKIALDILADIKAQEEQ